MTAATAFIIVASVLGFGLVFGFILWKFKYVIWKGWFRAVILCEDGDVIYRTMRLKISDTDFTTTVKGKLDTYHIIEIDETRQRRVYRTGKFRIPVAFYNAHQSEPIDMAGLRKESTVSATRYRELARNTVTAQLLTAFNENPLREAMAMFMAVVIILGGLLILGYFLNSRLETIIERL